MELHAASCPSPCISLSQAHPGNLCGVSVATLRRDPAKKTGSFTYTTNQNLLLENLKPLKARLEQGVGSYSQGLLGYGGRRYMGAVWWHM